MATASRTRTWGELDAATEMPRRPLSVTVTYGSILAAAMVWLALGVLRALNAHPAFPDDALPRNTMALLSLGAACLLLLLLKWLMLRRRYAHGVTVAVLAAASAAIFRDDVGLVDLAVLTISVIPLVLLLKDRAWYTRT